MEHQATVVGPKAYAKGLLESPQTESARTARIVAVDMRAGVHAYVVGPVVILDDLQRDLGYRPSLRRCATKVVFAVVNAT